MKFTKSHEWVLSSNHEATVGITNHAQELLGDLVYVELPKLGAQIKAGASVGVLESVKAASDLYSPLSGEVIAINENVVNDPTLINSSAENEAWLFKLSIANHDEAANLLSLEEYQNLIAE